MAEIDREGKRHRRIRQFIVGGVVLVVAACLAIVAFVAGFGPGGNAPRHTNASPWGRRCTEISTVTTSGGRLTVCVNYQYSPSRQQIVFESLGAAYRVANETGGLANPEVIFLFGDPAHAKQNYRLVSGPIFANFVYANQTKLIELAGRPVQQLGGDHNVTLTADLMAEQTAGSNPGVYYDVASLTISLHPDGLCVNPDPQNNPPCDDTYG